LFWKIPHGGCFVLYTTTHTLLAFLIARYEDDIIILLLLLLLNIARSRASGKLTLGHCPLTTALFAQHLVLRLFPLGSNVARIG
jgi:hypothetical protein